MKTQFKQLAPSASFIYAFEGLMLGDGYLTNVRKSPYSASLIVKNKFEDYLMYLSKLFSVEDIEHKVSATSKGSFAGSTRCFQLETKFYVTFHDLEQRWYSYEDGRRKVVPSDVVLTPETLLQWFIGDGYVVNLRGVPQRIQICTDRYTATEVEILREAMLRDFGLDTGLADRGRIRIPRREMSKFYDVLPECPCLSMSYKWPTVYVR